MVTAYIGLGANLGNRAQTLREAVRRLGELGDVLALSSLYETAPVGYLDQPPFLNAAAQVETSLAPTAMMSGLLAIERDLGRTRTFRNAPRTVDLDLLLVDDAVLDAPGLVLPHPRFHERAFVLVPLAEIAPQVVHPRLCRSVDKLLDEIAVRSGIRIWQARGWEQPVVDAARE